MKAQKLPSGSYRVQVYDSSEGKYKSFTAPTADEAVYAAMAWKTGHNQTKKKKHHKTVKTCVSEYIASKENLLSPSSIRGYIIILENSLDGISEINVDLLTEKDLQMWVNQNAARYSPKSVKSQFGLVTAALRQERVNLDYKSILLPRIQKKEPLIPTEEQMGEILRIVEGTNVELPVTLAVVLGLRQSEIAGLKWSDYDGSTLDIHAAVVPDKENKFVYKPTTKSEASTRKIPVNGILKERLDKAEHKTEFISPMLPTNVLKKFHKLCDLNGLPRFTMHAQRHANASLMLVMGVPDKYAMKRLGQSSPNMIKDIYQHLFEEREKEYSDTVTTAFDSIYHTKNHTKENE